MVIALASKPGLSGATTLSIPKEWDQKWFRSLIANQLKGADVRNATGVNGIKVSGTIASPYATIGFASPVTLPGPVTINTNAGTVALTINGATGQDGLDVKYANVTSLAVAAASIQFRGPIAAALVDMTPDTATWTGTLTGVSGTVTGTVTMRKMGQFANLTCTFTGTSTATTCTITGLPAAWQPATRQLIPTAGGILDNGVRVNAYVDLVPGSGTITFAMGTNFSTTAFTAAGSKGPSLLSVTYALLN